LIADGAESASAFDVTRDDFAAIVDIDSLTSIVLFGAAAPAAGTGRSSVRCVGSGCSLTGDGSGGTAARFTVGDGLSDFFGQRYSTPTAIPMSPSATNKPLGKAATIPITTATATAGADCPVDFRFLATVVPIDEPR
jgi:hypothetical protein